MATKLAALAAASELTGEVCITDLSGVTHKYADEGAACEAWEGKADRLEHRRGAFFEVVPEKGDAPPPPPPAPKKRSKRSEPEK